MTATWGGAQWVLATFFVCLTVWPPLFRATGYSRKTLPEWTGWYLSELAQRGGLIALLWWGGFWTQ